MKLGVISDLHLEFGGVNVVAPECDVICVAGDVHSSSTEVSRFLSRLSSDTGAKVVYVMGNHEYYGHDFKDCVDKYRFEIGVTIR